MRSRLLLLAFGIFLTRDSEAAPFRCGTVARPSAFAGIDCSSRPQLGSTLVSSIHPIAVHYDTADAALAQTVLESAETSWTVTTTTLGFEAPPSDGASGGDARFDFYLEVSQFGGYFCPEGPTPATDRAGYFGWVSINPEAFDASLIPAVVAHELNHASQLGIDVIETQAFMEMTSAYVMEKVYDDVNLAAPYIGYFQESPESALDYYVYAEPYQYGASLFLFWLFDEKLGDPSLVSDVWDAAKQVYDPTVQNEPDFMDVLDDWARARGETLDLWYQQFAMDRWFTGSFDDGTFTEGATYAEVAAAGEYAFSSVPGNPVASSVEEMGASYIEIDGTGATERMKVRIESDDVTEWAVFLLRKSDGSRAALPLDDGAATFALTPGKNVLAVVNVGDGNHDPDATYAANDWDESTFHYSLSYLDGGGEGCACALSPRARPSSFHSLAALLALAIVVRRRCV